MEALGNTAGLALFHMIVSRLAACGFDGVRQMALAQAGEGAFS